MKVSLNWITEYLDFELPPTDELVEKIGAQIGAVEEVIDLRKQYENIIVVKVEVCEPLENSDHLYICLVDDNGAIKDVERDDKGLVQVITGAPNVHAGMVAVWLSPGSTVPESFHKDPFVLSSRPMRGSMSHGMLASSRELAIGDSHEGIVEISESDLPHESNLKDLIGRSFAEVFGLDDTIIDIENKMFTHRPDCFGQLGLAREIAGILGYRFEDPEWYWVLPEFKDASGLELDIFNDAPEKSLRFMAVAMKDVVIKSSPLWLQCRLAAVGSRPINNVVDITNYIMLLTAQPTHAYDYDKLRGHKLGVRMANKGEKIKLLNGKSYELNNDDIVIADGEAPIGLAGIMGGGDSEVDDNTTNIVLEVASFDMYSIRKSSMKHGIFTDASTRFNKGQSIRQNDRVMYELMRLTNDISAAEQASKVLDYRSAVGENDAAQINQEFPVETVFINKRLGLKLKDEEIGVLLRNVHFVCSTTREGQLSVAAPFWRNDIDIPEDIVEEVGRLYGYDHLPHELPMRSIKPATKDELFELKRLLRKKLSSAGANEVLTYSFVHGNLLEKVGQDKEQSFKLSNALSPELQYYRMSLMPSLLDKVHPNIKAGYDEFALFELGKVHSLDRIDDNNLPIEDNYVGFVLAANNKLKKPGSAYYHALKYLDNLVGVKLCFKPIDATMREHGVVKPYDINRSAFVYDGEGTTFLGIIGEFKPSVTRNLKLPSYCAGFELDINAIGQLMSRGEPYNPIPRFPKVSQDICLKVPESVTYGELYKVVDMVLLKNKPGETIYKLSPLDIYQRSDDSDHKQITFRLTIASYEKTMQDNEVTKILDKVALAAHTELGADQV